MNTGLTQEQIEQYWSEGYIAQLHAISELEARALVPKFEQVRNRMSSWVASAQLLKSHLVVPWVNNLVRNPNILNAVESLLGPNIFVWGATFFAKMPENTKHVGWHQDLLYWGLQPDNGVLTVWLALTDAHEDNGAMRLVPGSHQKGIRHHSESEDSDNMLMGDQNIPLSDEELERAVTIELEPGQFSMHHSMTIHGSGPNLSSRARIGASINYISTDVVQLKNNGLDSAMLVRGVDDYGHFENEIPPQTEFASEGIAEYKKAIGMPSGLGTKEFDMAKSLIQYDKIA